MYENDVLKIIRFEKFNNIWVPVERDLSLSGIGRFGPHKQNYHIKQTDIVLNPDGNTFGLFVPDDILDGSKVAIIYSPKDYIKKPLRWQGGKVIDLSGMAVADFTVIKQENPKN